MKTWNFAGPWSVFFTACGTTGNVYYSSYLHMSQRYAKKHSGIIWDIKTTLTELIDACGRKNGTNMSEVRLRGFGNDEDVFKLWQQKMVEPYKNDEERCWLFKWLIIFERCFFRFNQIGILD